MMNVKQNDVGNSKYLPSYSCVLYTNKIIINFYFSISFFLKESKTRTTHVNNYDVFTQKRNHPSGIKIRNDWLLHFSFAGITVFYV